MMNKQIKKILKIPSELEKNGNTSLKEMIESNKVKKISIIDIHNCIDQEPRFFDDWLTFSENKRSSDGWYIRHKRSTWLVGCFDSCNFVEYKIRNKTKAFALFIYAEITSWR